MPGPFEIKWVVPRRFLHIKNKAVNKAYNVVNTEVILDCFTALVRFVLRIVKFENLDNYLK